MSTSNHLNVLERILVCNGEDELCLNLNHDIK